MALSEEAKLYIRKAFGDEQELEKTDPEFYEFFQTSLTARLGAHFRSMKKLRICRSSRCSSAAAWLTNSARFCPPL